MDYYKNGLNMDRPETWPEEMRRHAMGSERELVDGRCAGRAVRDLRLRLVAGTRARQARDLRGLSARHGWSAMSHASDQDAAGGLSLLHQEQQAAEQEMDRRVDEQWHALDRRLADHAIAFDETGYKFTLGFRLALLKEFRQILRLGVEAAASGALAEKILQETEP